MDVARLRTRAAWALALVYLWLARPTGTLLVAGFALGAAGLVVRAWAAGTVAKNERLTVSGPYAHVRHPLYLGSLLVGLGLTLPGGHWAWPALFLAFYVGVHARLVRDDEHRLAALFGEEHARWAREVPALLPRLGPWRPPTPEPVSGSGGFTLARYHRNREWRAALGFAAGWGVLVVKWMWG